MLQTTPDTTFIMEANNMNTDQTAPTGFIISVYNIGYKSTTTHA